MENILYALSELSLIGGICILMLKHLWGGQAVKDYFRTTKTALLLSLICRILFYNKDIWGGYYVSTPYTVVFYVFVVLTAYIWLSLSYRWFTSNDVPPFRFCVLALLAVLASAVIISALNLAVLFVGLAIAAYAGYAFLRFSQEEESFHPVSRRYGYTMLVFGGCFIISLVLTEPQNWPYAHLSGYLAYIDRPVAMLIIGGILFWVMSMMGVVPLHFWLPDAIAPAVLPVAAYFILIPFFSLWAAFIHLNMSVLEAYREPLTEFYRLVGVLSVCVGALGVHAGRQIKKMLVYILLFNVGVFLIVLAPFDEASAMTGLVCIQIYMVAVLGLCACQYAFKSHREYLNNLSMLHGMASVRPYLAVVLLAVLLSLMQIAPFPGFVGLLGVLHNLMTAGAYVSVGVILVGLLVLSAAFIRLIQAIFFMPRQREYDRSDQGIYLYLSIVMILMGIFCFYPKILMTNARLILSGLENF